MKIKSTDINNTNLTAYAGGDTPSAFTLGIVDSADAAAWRTAIGAGTSSTTGTVTSVNISGGTTGLTFSDGPITSSGTLIAGGTLAVTNGGTGASTAATAPWVQKSGDTMSNSLTLQPASGASINIRMITEGEAAPSVIQTVYRDASSGANGLIAQKARGTTASPTVVQANDRIMVLQSQGYDSIAFQAVGYIMTEIMETTPGVGAMGTRMKFYLCPTGSGSISFSSGEVARLEYTTGLSMYGANPVIDNNRIHRLRVYTVGTLPTVGTQGRLCAVSDANGPTYNATVAGGGTVKIPVYDNGTNWTCH